MIVILRKNCLRSGVFLLQSDETRMAMTPRCRRTTYLISCSQQSFSRCWGWGRAKWGRSDCEPFQSRPPSHREQRPGGKVLWEKWWQFGWWFHQIDGWSLLSSLLPDQVGQLGLHLWSAREVEAAKLQGPCSLRTPRGIGDESGQWFEAWLLRGLLPCMSLDE